ncbi:MAG TPA: hypothetical protein VFO69_12850 [Allosphingosinicella sp.]|nr:hypothetical protein [Allosphingosinicella sp.]
MLKFRLGLPVVTAILLAGCVSPARDQPRSPTPAQSPAATYTNLGLEGVMGQTAPTLVRLLGQPDLDVREGPARKLQFLAPACVLDAYLYPRRSGDEAVVTHVDARLPDGRDMDRASCVAALTAQRQAR